MNPLSDTNSMPTDIRVERIKRAFSRAYERAIALGLEAEGQQPTDTSSTENEEPASRAGRAGSRIERNRAYEIDSRKLSA